MGGVPETRPEERERFLGELQERILVALSEEEIARPSLDQRVVKAMADSRARMLILRGDVPFEETAKYRQLASQKGLTVTIRNDPSFEGEVGLVVASDEALE